MKFTYKKLDVVAVKQGTFTVRGSGNAKAPEGVEWRVGLVLSVDNSTGHNHIFGRYVAEDGALTDDHFDLYADSMDVQLVDRTEVIHTVRVPPTWKKGLVSGPPKPPKEFKLGPVDDEPPDYHPSYGVVTVTRGQSTGTKLFMSPFRHQNAVTMRIGRASRHRSLSQDRTFGEGELLEVEMSETQWARLLSSIGIGEGVPCTIRTVSGEVMPECPERDEKAKFMDEIQGHADEAAEKLRVAHERVRAILTKPSVTKADVREIEKALSSAYGAMASGAPFTVKQFVKKMEEVVDAAKTEVDLFIQNAAQQTGLKQLTQGGPISFPALPAKKEPK